MYDINELWNWVSRNYGRTFTPEVIIDKLGGFYDDPLAAYARWGYNGYVTPTAYEGGQVTSVRITTRKRRMGINAIETQYNLEPGHLDTVLAYVEVSGTVDLDKLSIPPVVADQLVSDRFLQSVDGHHGRLGSRGIARLRQRLQNV